MVWVSAKRQERKPHVDGRMPHNNDQLNGPKAELYCRCRRQPKPNQSFFYELTKLFLLLVNSRVNCTSQPSVAHRRKWGRVGKRDRDRPLVSAVIAVRCSTCILLLSSATLLPQISTAIPPATPRHSPATPRSALLCHAMLQPSRAVTSQVECIFRCIFGFCLLHSTIANSRTLFVFHRVFAPCDQTLNIYIYYNL